MKTEDEIIEVIEKYFHSTDNTDEQFRRLEAILASYILNKELDEDFIEWLKTNKDV